MGDLRVQGSSALKAGSQQPAVEQRMLEILGNPRMYEYAKVAELKKLLENMPQAEKLALYERLKDRKSKDHLSQQFHYWLSHRPYQAGALSTVDQILNVLNPSAAQQSSATSQGSKTTGSARGSSPAMIDARTADALARSRILKDEAMPGTPVNVSESILKPGETISAKLTTKIVKPYEQRTFDFSRPVTKEQASAIIFQKGQLPPDVLIEKGAGNAWIIKVPNDMEAMQNATSHYNSHEGTIVHKQRQPTDIAYPEPDVTFSWTGGKLAAANPRKDLKNDYGFVIAKRYRLDEGQSPDANVRTLVRPGSGFEVKFEKPMTKSQVMEKFFNKDVSSNQVRLIAVPGEPATTWQVQMLDGTASFKRPAAYAFHDAISHAKHTVPPNTPDGVRAHLENQTVPANAKKFSPDVHVWEQDGYLVRVQTNGKKGDAGYYKYEATKLNPGDKPGNDTMRWLMLERGLPVREAWQEYIQHWDQIHAGMLGMVGGAGRFMPRGGAGTAVKVTARTPRSNAGNTQQPASTQSTPSAPKPQAQPPAAAKSSNTVQSHPAPMPQPQAPKPKSKPAPAPVPEGQKTFGRGEKTENHQQEKVIIPGKGKTLPGSLTRKLPRRQGDPPKIEWLPKRSGTKLTDQQVWDVHAIDPSRIGWSMSKAEHQRQWQSANPGSKEPPPTAFTTKDGRVQVSEEAWLQSGQPALWGLVQE